MKNRKRTRFITQSAIIAAMYVVLTYVTSFFGLASGAVQCRLSEALLVLPMFTPSAIPGLFIGCALSNLMTGCILPDVVFGSIATLFGAVGAYVFKDKHPVLATLPNVLSNMLIVPLVLRYAYALDEGLLYFVATVGAGEIISCSILGFAMHVFLKPHARILFK